MNSPKDKLKVEKFYFQNTFVFEIAHPYSETGYSQQFRIGESELLNTIIEDNYFDKDFSSMEDAKNYVKDGLRRFARKVLEGLSE